MSFDAPADLHAFLDVLRRERALVEIDTEVDPKLEIAEIHRRVIAAGGPALLFKNVRGADIPVVTNLFGTKQRVDLAFGTRPEEIIKEVAKLPEEMIPPTPGKLWAKRKLFGSLMKVGTKKVKGGPVTEVAEAPGLDRLPAITSWEEDGGPFVTLPLVYTEHPETGVPNLGMYRMHVFDEKTTGMHFQIGKGGGYHLTAAGDLGQERRARDHRLDPRWLRHRVLIGALHTA